MTEREFHNQRRAFAIYDGRLNWSPDNFDSHREWLVDTGLFSDAQFEELVRGYVDDTGIYFYQGSNFETNEYVEDMAKSWMNSIDTRKPVYCGVIRGKVGERWKPIKQIRHEYVMYGHDDCNKKVANECLRLIDQYRGIKENSIYDIFYHSHLDCFESLIIDWKRQEEDCYAVIMRNDANGLPLYVTVCMKPHFDSEGIMQTSSLYDATKFDLSCRDLSYILRHIRNKCSSDFRVVVVDKGVFGKTPRELWSDSTIRGNFDDTGAIAGVIVGEI